MVDSAIIGRGQAFHCQRIFSETAADEAWLFHVHFTPEKDITDDSQGFDFLCDLDCCILPAFSVGDAASQMVTSAESSPLAARAIETASVATSSVVTSNPPHLSLATQVRLSLRLVAAGAMGGAIGKERSERYRQADKIMGMVAVGAAMFSICSVIGFSGTHYDASRMASTVASGVGFIGAGVIYHEPYNAEKSEMPQASGDEPKSDMVHGLTTAAAIFMSAAIGVSCGVGLYILSGVSTLATLAILRIGGNVKYRSYERRRLESIRREKALLIQERLKSLRDFEQLKRMEHLWREQQSHLMDELGSGAVRQELSGNQTRAGIEKTMVESRDFGRRSRGKDTT
eukprot:CAMPEP_0168736058 /NCGR_PEP_ID=MMETSP0724-20121128/9667_1 /TAXON_ID=265536 /ORGANISM="Amphiprora sp., Strain CCMP467" /LENGTH=342 /DNA_ID=CAMNT_0008783249 /DNA_START=295 /DNA_END=1324 /DNA_ORIENTATION=-